MLCGQENIYLNSTNINTVIYRLYNIYKIYQYTEKKPVCTHILNTSN